MKPIPITIQTQVGIGGSPWGAFSGGGADSVLKLKVALQSLGIGSPFISMAFTRQK
jgi:hypothetical protein